MPASISVGAVSNRDRDRKPQLEIAPTTILCFTAYEPTR